MKNGKRLISLLLPKEKIYSMNKMITVIGLLEKNSGKTFLIKNLINLLSDKYSIIPFKPISGSNYWNHPENTKYFLKNRLLLSQDLRDTVSEVTDPLSIPLSILNPIHTLFSPKNVWRLMNGRTTLKQINHSNYWSIDEPVLIRYSIWDELQKSEKKIHVISKRSIPPKIKPLVEICDEKYFFDSFDDLAMYDKKYSFLSIKSAFSLIKQKANKEVKESIVFTESFNDIVPFQKHLL